MAIGPTADKEAADAEHSGARGVKYWSSASKLEEVAGSDGTGADA